MQTKFKVIFFIVYAILYLKLLIDVLTLKPLFTSIPLHMLFLICLLFIALNNYKNRNTTFFLLFINATLLVSGSFKKTPFYKLYITKEQ
jgi:isoprenylcysteine carboxyl methyltransferase (ICMT) family protein YpbQ